MKRSSRNPEVQRRRRPTLAIVLAGVAVFVALGGTAVAASGLVHGGDIATGAVASRAIRDGGVELQDLSRKVRASLEGGLGAPGATGAKGDTGSGGGAGTAGHDGANGSEGAKGAAGTNGVNGANGPNGANGANGAEGPKGSNGTNGTNGLNGANGPAGANGANGPNGANGVDGTNGTNGSDGAKGTNGTNGVNGTNGTNGTISPLAAKQGLTALPTGVSATTVVELAVPAGNYVVLAKTELSHTGAGDSVECALKAGAITLDQVAMKTLPALAAIPASLQAVATTTGPTQLTVQCAVAVANGAANYSSLIAIPTA